MTIYNFYSCSTCKDILNEIRWWIWYDSSLCSPKMRVFKKCKDYRKTQQCRIYHQATLFLYTQVSCINYLPLDTCLRKKKLLYKLMKLPWHTKQLGIRFSVWLLSKQLIFKIFTSLVQIDKKTFGILYI